MIGVIGGSGLNGLDGLSIKEEKLPGTPYGQPSAPLVFGELSGRPLVFLARHGTPHCIPPHLVNYRANIYALKETGVTEIVAVNAVGGITAPAANGVLVIPDQLIDYTWGREHTYSDGKLAELQHADFTTPFNKGLRQRLLKSIEAAGVAHHCEGVYGVTQGPRLETAAEIQRMESDGCDIVGMTAMPEAALAAELGIPYAMMALVVNKAAGKSDSPITMEEIEAELEKGMGKIREILAAFIAK
jgi:5'-methylthioinosine phosphorylase